MEAAKSLNFCHQKTYEFVEGNNGSQLVIATTTIAADLVRVATFGPPAADQNLESFATATLGCGMGFYRPQLAALAPWCANIAMRNGVALDKMGRTALRRGWYLNGCISVGEVEKAAEVAAYSESSVQMAAYQIDALRVKLADTRRAM